jgi:hypothetical protein
LISQIYINDWRQKAKWRTDAQVEQDLIISTALQQPVNNLRNRLFRSHREVTRDKFCRSGYIWALRLHYHYAVKCCAVEQGSEITTSGSSGEGSFACAPV